MEAQRRAVQAMEFQHAEASALGQQRQAGAVRGGGAAAVATASHMPFVRSERKVGRNEPCPCGSGKKYKQCHGRLS